MRNFNPCKSNTVLMIVIVAQSLTEVIALRQTEVLVNESAFISCFSKEVKSIQWHHTPPGKLENKYVYAGGRFYPPYNTGRFRVDNNSTTNMFTLVITNVTHEDAGLYECKDDVLSGVFGSTHLTVLDSSPICTSNMNPNGFAGPNTCNIEQENMAFSCAVSFSGNSPNLMWSTLNSTQSLKSPVCESKDNRINCSLSMKADPSFDGSTFICQTTTSNDARYNCSIEDIRVEYFFGDYEDVEKRVGDNVTCVVVSNLQIHYNWTIGQNNEDNIFSTNRTIYLQKPGFYKCSVKYNIRKVTCNATIVAVNVSNIVDGNVSREQSKALAIGVSLGISMCLVAVVIAFLLHRQFIKGFRLVPPLRLPVAADTTSQKPECLLPSNAIATPGGDETRVDLIEVSLLRREFFIVSKMNSKVLDIRHGDSSPGASVIVWPRNCPTSRNQLWYFDSNGFIHSALNDLVPESRDEAQVKMARFRGDGFQQWTFDGNKIVSRAGDCLDIRESYNRDGSRTARVISYTYCHTPNQHWRLELAYAQNPEQSSNDE